MSYDYVTLKPKLFTEEGQDLFVKIRDHVRRLLDQAGAVRMDNAISVGAGDSRLMLACVDRMVERGELDELTNPGQVPGQFRVFVESG